LTHELHHNTELSSASKHGLGKRLKVLTAAAKRAAARATTDGGGGGGGGAPAASTLTTEASIIINAHFGGLRRQIATVYDEAAAARKASAGTPEVWVVDGFGPHAGGAGGGGGGGGDESGLESSAADLVWTASPIFYRNVEELKALDRPVTHRDAP
jgi:hypothetical protein